MTLRTSVVSIGEIRPFLRGSIPDGWLPCDGQQLRIAGHAELFEAIGTLYGGDGITNFVLPDLVGRRPVHPNADPARGPVLALGQALEAANGRSRLGSISPVIYAISAPDHRRRRRGNALQEQLMLGEIRLYAGAVPPRGLLPCEGQALRFDQHPALAAMLDGVYGGEDFIGYMLPDFRSVALAAGPREFPGPLGTRWIGHGRRGMATQSVDEVGAVLAIGHLVSTSGQLPLVLAR